MELKEYIQLFLRRKLIILTTIGIIIPLVVLFIFLVTPIYQANSKLLIAENSTSGLLNSLGGTAADLLLQETGKSDPVSTQIEIIKTRPIILKTIELSNLIDNDNKFISYKDFIENLDISSVRNTNVVQLNYKHKSPNIAANVLNKLAKVVIEENQQFNRQELTASKEFIQEQLLVQKDILNKTEEKVLDYRNKYKAVNLEEETVVRLKNVVELETQKHLLIKERIGLLAQNEDLKKKTNQIGAATKTFYAEWMKQHELNNIKLISLDAQINELKTQIKNLNNDLNELPKKQLEMVRLVRDQQVANNIYTNLLVQNEEIKIREAAKVASVFLIEPSVVPELPIFPQKKKILLLGIIASIVLSFSLALLLEYLDNNIHSENEVKEILNYPILGKIVKAKKYSITEFINNKKSSYAECFRLLYSNLKFCHQFHDNNILLVTSSKASEGKTSLTINLGFSMVEQGKKVALLDLDLRCSSWEDKLNRNFKIGLSDYIIGDVEEKDIEYYDKDYKLTFIPSGTIPPNSTELLNTQKFVTYLDNLRKKFDVVICDGAPITLVSEILSISSHVDGILLVVDMENGNKDSIKNMSELVTVKKSLPILGTVLTKLQDTSSKYYYYGKD